MLNSMQRIYCIHLYLKLIFSLDWMANCTNYFLYTLASQSLFQIWQQCYWRISVIFHMSKIQKVKTYKKFSVNSSAIICDYPKLMWARIWNSRLEDGHLVLQPETLFFVLMPEVWLQASTCNISHYLKILQILINLQSRTLDTINRSIRTQKET